MTATDTKNLSVEEWTYLGQRMISGGKPGHAWMDPTGETRYYGGKNIASAGVGAVYSVHVDHADDRASVVTGGTNAPRYLRMTDDDRAPQWQLDDEITRTRVEAERAARRAKDDRPMGNLTLDQLTASYQGLATADQRAGMLAAIVKYLERGR